MTSYIPFWANDPTVLFNKDYILQMWPLQTMTFDEKLKNYADQKIKLDLDDGVKVNYAKFADILAEVKAVTGGSEE